MLWLLHNFFEMRPNMCYHAVNSSFHKIFHSHYPFDHLDEQRISNPTIKKIIYLAISIFTFGLANLLHYTYQYATMNRECGKELIKVYLQACIRETKQRGRLGQNFAEFGMASRDALNYGMDIVFSKQLLNSKVSQEIKYFLSISKKYLKIWEKRNDDSKKSNRMLNNHFDYVKDYLNKHNLNINEEYPMVNEKTYLEHLLNQMD